MLIDDHPIVRRGLRRILERQGGIKVCAESSEGSEGIEICKRYKPNLAVVDLTMPVMDGFEVTRRIRQECPATQVLVLTMHCSEDMARKAMHAGCLGYALKADVESELVQAVRHMRRLEPFFSGRLAPSRRPHYAPVRGVSSITLPVVSSDERTENVLTKRQIDVVRLLATGKTNKEVAAELGISRRTAETHREHAMATTRSKTFADLIRFAIRHNVVDI